MEALTLMELEAAGCAAEAAGEWQRDDCEEKEEVGETADAEEQAVAERTAERDWRDPWCSRFVGVRTVTPVH